MRAIIAIHVVVKPFLVLNTTYMRNQFAAPPSKLTYHVYFVYYIHVNLLISNKMLLFLSNTCYFFGMG